ncbi:GSCOCG00009470001-RA-CDS, partial [Cotesia congregata]
DDDDETDDDEVYMTPNQVVSPHRKLASKIEQPGLERYDTAPLVSVEPAAGVSPRNNELECDPDALTQIIPLNTNTNACKKINNDHEVCDEFAPTQLVNPVNNFKDDDDDETDDEELESLRREVDDKKNQGLINKNEVNKLKTCDQDLNDAPTQLLNLETQKLNIGIEETQKLLETQRDDLEPTQLIDSQAIFLSLNKNNKISQTVKESKNKNNDDSIDSVDLENAPTQIINFEGPKKKCELKHDNLDEKSLVKNDRISRRASSTPLSSGKRKIKFTAVKNCTVDLDKLQGDNLNSDEKKSINKKKEFENNDKVNSSDLHNDSLVRNLDAMFGGSNDDEFEDAIPLQTQQLKEILDDVPEKLHSVNNFQKPGSQENKINLVNKKSSESQVDSGPDTQEAYFAKLSSRKKKSNILVDSQGSSSSQKSGKSQGKAAKKVVYAPGTAGFSNGVPVEGDESVAVYESPEKKLKTKG